MIKGIGLCAATAIVVGGCCMGGGGSSTIALSGPGFTPNPTLSSGSAGGITQASSIASSDALGNSCLGNLPATAQHTVVLATAVPLLRILVNSDQDTTLLVRTPTGQIYCNDDSGDPGHAVNPVVGIPNAAAGSYEVFVGAYSSSSTLAPYTIGFTETASTFPSQVVH